MHKIIIKIIVCLETPFSKNSNHIEISQMTCNANQLTGFYMTRVLRKDVSEQTPVNLFRPGRLLNVLCTFNLRPVSTGLQAMPRRIR